MPEIETNFEKFANRLKLSEEERKTRKKLLDESFMPFQVTEYYTQLIETQPEPSRSQLLNIVLPPYGIKNFNGRFDPYGNVSARQQEGSYLQHKYTNTLLFHLNDFCFANCQFCFKVSEIRLEDKVKESYKEKTSNAVKYLNKHPEIDNVLLTGGDPATRNTNQLTSIINQLAKQDNIKVIRFATKGLSFEPKRFQDRNLLDFFKVLNKKKRINIIAQYNHPCEISAESKKSLKMLQESGVHIYGQPAIIKGVNDDIQTLIDLQNRFLENNIQSYYLVSFMPVKGVEQYALPLDETFRIVAESKKRLNGLAKKGILVAPHDWGKLEIIGFLPSLSNPDKILFKWHELAMQKYLPPDFRDHKPEDLLELKFKKNSFYFLDQVLEYNNLPHK